MDTKLLRRLIPVLVVGYGALLANQAPPRARFTPPPYFPLAVGNQWIFVQRGRIAGEPVTAEVTSTARFNGNTYYQLSGFTLEPAWVRYTPGGELVQYDPSGGSEKLWYMFSAPEGTSWRPQLPEPCVERASLRSRNVEVRVPAGTFSSNVVIDYATGACADAGFSEEAFAPGVGPLRRTSNTIAGPRTFELAYARVGDVTIAGSELSFVLAIDRPIYTADFMPPVDPARSVPLLRARLSIRNSSTLPVSLMFGSGQQYDLAIRDDSGRQVYLWSEGKVFTLALVRVELSPGEKTFLVEIPLADRSGKTFPEGRYTLEAWLATTGGKKYSATLPFEIRYTF